MREHLTNRWLLVSIGVGMVGGIGLGCLVPRDETPPTQATTQGVQRIRDRLVADRLNRDVSIEEAGHSAKFGSGRAARAYLLSLRDTGRELRPEDVEIIAALATNDPAFLDFCLEDFPHDLPRPGLARWCLSKLTGLNASHLWSVLENSDYGRGLLAGSPERLIRSVLGSAASLDPQGALDFARRHPSRPHTVWLEELVARAMAADPEQAEAIALRWVRDGDSTGLPDGALLAGISRLASLPELVEQLAKEESVVDEHLSALVRQHQLRSAQDLAAAGKLEELPTHDFASFDHQEQAQLLRNAIWSAEAPPAEFLRMHFSGPEMPENSAGLVGYLFESGIGKVLEEVVSDDLDSERRDELLALGARASVEYEAELGRGLALAGSITDGGSRARALSETLLHQAHLDPAGALERIELIQDPALREETEAAIRANLP